MQLFQEVVHDLAADEVKKGSTLVPVVLLFFLSVVIGAIGLDHLPRNDELYTLLAARGWLIDGVPRIADGVYDRAQLYTILVAQFLRVFGESLAVARLPSLIAGSLLVVAVFVWTRSVAGNLAAWIAALFVCLSPLTIQMSQYARFYTLFGLLFWLGAVGIYALVEAPPAVDIGSACRWLCCLSGSRGSSATACDDGPDRPRRMAGLAVVVPWLWSQRHRPRRLWLTSGSAALAVLIAGVLAIQAGLRPNCGRNIGMLRCTRRHGAV